MTNFLSYCKKVEICDRDLDLIISDIQVSLLSIKEVLARELELLRHVKDAYPKYI